MRRRLLGGRTDFTLSGKGIAGRLLTRIFGAPEFPAPYDWNWLRHASIRRRDKILDFGCGTGGLLYYLRANGFLNLFGVDPFSGISLDTPELKFSNSLDIKWKGQFDLIMLHHSLEHVAEPEALLKTLIPFGRAGGSLLIRVPIADSAVAKKYQENWVQLDAPRHLTLPSEKGLRALGARLGLDFDRVDYDSTAFQFIGSEQYSKDISMYDPENSWLLGKNSPFDARERQDFEEQARVLNKNHQGDQAVFLWRLPADSTPKA